MRWELLSRNPADAVDPPKVERGAMVTFDMAQTADLLELLRGTRVLIPVMLGALCGLRRGEIAALRWRHVDLSAGKLAVVESAEQTATAVRYKPPKSGRGRTVALSATIIAELRAHRLRQAEELLRVGVRQSDATFIYSREDGEPMQPRSLSRAWEQAIRRTTLPRIRFHDLRQRPRDPPAIQWRTSKNRVQNDSVTRALGSRSIYTAMYFPECRRMRPRALTMPWREAVNKRATKSIG